MRTTIGKSRVLSIAAFSLLFAYLLSFLFEGRVMYGLMAHFGANAPLVVTLAMVSHLAGLFSCGYFVKSPGAVRKALLAYVSLCALGSVPFFFPPGPLWLVSGIVCGFVAGCAVAAWGYFFKTLSTKAERLRTCADCLAGTYILLSVVNLTSSRVSPFIGLSLSMLCLLGGALCAWRLPLQPNEQWTSKTRTKLTGDLKKPLFALCGFILILTINSGLMYQAVDPAFAQLSWLTSWYTELPYIAALLIVRRLSLRTGRTPRSTLLYAGLGLLVLSFLAFMLTSRSVSAYLIVGTLMVFAFGIFDLFWWSILGEMLDFTDNPVKLFGAGLSANVLGVLLGRFMGEGFAAMKLSSANITVTALVVICVALAILPPLNRQLVLLLKSHAYLTAYSELPDKGRQKAITAIQPLDPLTERESEVLGLILEGKSNKVIAAESFVTENTIKTHVKSIFSKYGVASRAELISLLLRNQIRYT
ncbi:MAG: response regulator transcription factor [Eubacteriales bacterium]|nr:response regulator transcription factor [Eubacteriales bacterium]